MPYLLALLITLAGFAQPSLAQTVTELYQPSQKTAQELQANLQSLYRDEVKFVISDNQLLIRGEATVVDEIQELLLQLDKPARLFWLTLSHTPVAANSKHYGTNQTRSLQTFRLSEGEPLYLARHQNRQQLDTVGWWQTSITEVPSQAEYLSLTVNGSNQAVQVKISSHSLINNRHNRTSNLVKGGFDEWLAIAAEPVAANSKRYSTRRLEGELYLKVSRQQPRSP